jgi:chromate reductase, NAD(P)H dehydrogenase (quinone)
MATISILGIAGSLRKSSFNKMALREAQGLVPEDATLDIFDLGGIPLFNQDLEQTPAPIVVEFKKRIRAADAILFVTPEYNYSVPGVLKNAIDNASRPYGDSAWTKKPAAIMGASIGNFGSARAQYHLRQTLVGLNVLVLNQPEVMIASAAQKFDENGNLTDEPTKQLIQKLLAALVASTKMYKANS